MSQVTVASQHYYYTFWCASSLDTFLWNIQCYIYSWVIVVIYFSVKQEATMNSISASIT